MNFEVTVRRFVGKKADGIAGHISTSMSARRPWIRIALAIAECRLSALDTAARHRVRLATELAWVREALGTRGEPSWAVVDALLAVIASLLGLMSSDGKARYQVAYFQGAAQHSADEADRGVFVNRVALERNAYAKRRAIMLELKTDGYSILEIARVFQASQHTIAQELKREEA